MILADNHFAAEAPLRSFLSGLLPATRVGGFIEYMLFLDDGGEVPAVFVYHGGDRHADSQRHQTLLTQAWKVVLATAPERDFTGNHDLAEHGRLLAEILRGLAGKRIDEDSKPLTWAPAPEGEEALAYGNGMLLSFLTFHLPVELR